MASDIKALLKTANPKLKLYVSQLEKENAKLQTQIAKYQVNQVSLDNRVKALEKEVEKQAKKPSFTVVLKKFADKNHGNS